MKAIALCAILFITGCDNFSISGHTYRQYESICSELGGLKRAYFRLGDGNKVILDELVCKNGVTLTYEYVKERFVSEADTK